MVRIISLILLFLPSVCFGWGAFPMQMGAPVVSGSCTTPQDGDIANEGFEGIGTELTWTGAIGTWNPDSTWGGAIVTGGCSDAVEFTGVSQAYRTYSIGASYNDIWIRFKFVLTSESLANFDSAEVLWMDNDTTVGIVSSNAQCWLYLQQDGTGVVHLYMDSPNGTQIDGGAITIGQEYSVSLLGGNRWAGAAYMQFDVTSGDSYGVLSDSGQLMGSDGISYIHLGLVTAPSADVTFELDVLQIDDDGVF